MAEPKKAAAPKAGPPAAPILARASESTDPSVHQVMAELQSARMNADDARTAELVARLSELGCE